MREKILLSWSGGKDSAVALYELKRQDAFEITALITSITDDFNRVSMHGVRKDLIQKQAESIGIKLDIFLLSKDATNEEYERRMEELLLRYKSMGVSTVAFGDIFLEDLRNYREKNLSRIGMKGIFPLWGIDSLSLAYRFIGIGFKAVITCVDSSMLDGIFVGREYDRSFLDELPHGVDPCGENGEFHTFVYDGPIFKEKIPFKIGDVILRNNRFYFCDLIPG